jgi:hypothetical protein
LGSNLKITTSFIFRSDDTDLLLQASTVEVDLRVLVNYFFENSKGVSDMHIIFRFKAGLEGGCQIFVPLEHDTLELVILKINSFRWVGIPFFQKSRS